MGIIGLVVLFLVTVIGYIAYDHWRHRNKVQETDQMLDPLLKHQQTETQSNSEVKTESQNQTLEQNAVDQTDAEIASYQDNTPQRVSYVPSFQETYSRNLKTSDIIVYYLQAPEDSFFEGNTLLNLLQKHELTAGSHQVFHKCFWDEKNNIRRLVFSMANGSEPGTLRIKELAGMKIQSLSFFMDYVRSHRPIQYFDHMILVAQDFMQVLGGKLVVKGGSPLTLQRINHDRENVRVMLHKRLQHKKNSE